MALDWFWDPIFRTDWDVRDVDSFRVTFKSFWDLTGKSALLVQSALLWISQPDFQNQSIAIRCYVCIKKWLIENLENLL